MLVPMVHPLFIPQVLQWNLQQDGQLARSVLHQTRHMDHDSVLTHGVLPDQYFRCHAQM